jgi:CRISPR-associated protein Cmr4
LGDNIVKTTLYYLHALTALHAGTGQGIGDIDQPIAREQSTGLPIIPGSGIKGVLREELRPDSNDDKKTWLTLFGPDSTDAEKGGNNGFSAALNLQDAQLLCLPIRSVYGTFAWATCPFILKRFNRDLIGLDGKAHDKITTPTVLEDQVIVTSNSVIHLKGKTDVYLEDLDLCVKQTENADDIATNLAQRFFPLDDEWQQEFKSHFIILPDQIFSFLAETATEVRARIRLQEGTRTVAKGALWYEENLPVETLLWGMAGIDRSRNPADPQTEAQLFSHFSHQLLTDTETRLQIGGNATVGRGHVRWLMETGE